MPAGLIEQDNAMRPRFDGLGNFCQVERHGPCVAAGQHQAGTEAVEVRLGAALVAGDSLDARVVLLTLHARVIQPSVVERYGLEAG